MPLLLNTCRMRWFLRLSMWQKLPHSLEEIILKCTQKSPDRRYSTLAELINDLKHSLIDPNGNFVNLTPLSNHAQTIMITPDEMKEIQNSAYTQPSSIYNDEEDDEDDEDEEIFENHLKNVAADMKRTMRMKMMTMKNAVELTQSWKKL